MKMIPSEIPQIPVFETPDIVPNITQSGDLQNEEKRSIGIEKITELIEDGELRKEKDYRENPLDFEKIHPIFSKYYENYEGKTEAGKEQIASSQLISYAVALGNGNVIQIGSGIRGNLYLIIIGKSSTMRKTTAMNLGLRPLTKINEGRKKEFSKRWKVYQEKLEIWKKNPKKGGKPNFPIDRSVIYPNEVTTEALLQKMQGQDYGLFRYSEIGGWLASLRKSYLAGQKELFTDFYDIQPVSYVRELRKERFEIKNPCLSILGCATLQNLQGFISDQDFYSGFMGRILFSVRRKGPENYTAIPEQVTLPEEFSKIIENLLHLENRYQISGEAKEFYTSWYCKNMEEIEKKEVILHSGLVRLQDVFHKIALQSFCIDLVTGKAEGTEIRLIDYQRAFPWIDYFTIGLESCYRDIQDPLKGEESRILDIIKKRGKIVKKNCFECYEITQSKLTRYSGKKLDALKDILNSLLAKRLIRKEENGKRNYWQIRK